LSERTPAGSSDAALFPSLPGSRLGSQARCLPSVLVIQSSPAPGNLSNHVGGGPHRLSSPELRLGPRRAPGHRPDRRAQRDARRARPGQGDPGRCLLGGRGKLGGSTTPVTIGSPGPGAVNTCELASWRGQRLGPNPIAVGCLFSGLPPFGLAEVVGGLGLALEALSSRRVSFQPQGTPAPGL